MRVIIDNENAFEELERACDGRQAVHVNFKNNVVVILPNRSVRLMSKKQLFAGARVWLRVFTSVMTRCDSVRAVLHIGRTAVVENGACFIPLFNETIGFGTRASIKTMQVGIVGSEENLGRLANSVRCKIDGDNGMRVRCEIHEGEHDKRIVTSDKSHPAGTNIVLYF
jgi:hypothetical protein